MCTTKKNGMVGQRHGFTIIEVIIVIVIFVILATLGIVMGMSSYYGYAFRSEETTLVAVLEKARNQAMVNVDQAPHGVHIDQDGYTVFEGTSYLNRVQSLDETIPAYPTITVSSNQSLPVDIIFAQLDGSVINPPVITLAAGTRSADVVINSEGGISW